MFWAKAFLRPSFSPPLGHHQALSIWLVFVSRLDRVVAESAAAPVVALPLSAQPTEKFLEEADGRADRTGDPANRAIAVPILLRQRPSLHPSDGTGIRTVRYLVTWLD